MDLRLEAFKPKPATWLKTKIEYIGVGHAVFEEPAGVIKGSAKATFDEDGSYSIEMEAEEVEGLFPTKENKCTQLTIITFEGIFSVIGKINYHHFIPNLEFFIIQSKFEAESSGEEHYWVLPLTNFISNFTQTDKALDQHPLRIYPTPVLPEKLFQKERNLAHLCANSKNSLLIFEYSERLAFIEALYNYKENKDKLREGKDKALITAVMVGQVDLSASNQESLSKPSNLLPFLGFASGAPVGSPWMEFHDQQGKLSRRIHQSLNNAPYRKGHIVLHDYVGISKIGNFLTLAQSSRNFDKDHVLISASLAIESGFFSFNITDALANLFRAFDILCKDNELHSTNLSRELDESYKIQIKQILKQASTEIKQISSSITDTNLISQKSSIEKIAERVIQSQNQVNDAGLAIEKLLIKLGFHDASILNQYYVSNPRIDNRKWHQLLSYCRGVAMHDIRIDDLYLDDLLIVKDHLYDILIRIVFHLIGYQGTYTPIFARNTSGEISVGWVDANLPASRLGYR